MEGLTSQEIGELGEKIAAKYLQARGWKFLYRNFRAAEGGEVDLIFRGGDQLDLLIFAEVKTRTRRDFGRPMRAVNQKKRELIVRGASEWLKFLSMEAMFDGKPDLRRQISWRYDVVEIILEEGKKPDVTLVEQAF